MFLRTRNPIGFCQRCADTAKSLRSVNDVLICNNYHLEIPLYSMKYDKAKNSIYGIGYNPEGVFIEYKL